MTASDRAAGGHALAELVIANDRYVDAAEAMQQAVANARQVGWSWQAIAQAVGLHPETARAKWSQGRRGRRSQSRRESPGPAPLPTLAGNRPGEDRNETTGEARRLGKAG